MRTAFIAVVAAQLLFLAVEAGRYGVMISAAPTIMLRVVPIDPRSIFLGNYAWLNYDVNMAAPEKMSAGSLKRNELADGQEVWVGFEPKPDGAVVRTMLRKPPSAQVPGLLFLRATVSGVDRTSVNLDYGLERYYIPEEREQEVNDIFTRLRENPKKTRVTAEVAVLANGQGVVQRLLVNGKPLPF